MDNSNQKRKSVSDQLLSLFSDQAASLASLYQMAMQLAEMPGIHSFHTPLPWTLQLEGRHIQGSSEDLYHAAKDIVAQLHYLKEQHGQAALAILTIDEARLRPSLFIQPLADEAV